MNNPTERARRREHFVSDPPAKIVGRLAATEDALFAMLQSLPTTAKQREEHPMLLRNLLKRLEVPSGVEAGVVYRQGYSQQISVLETFAD